MAATGDQAQTIEPSAVRDELERLLAGPLASSPQLVAFLRFVVEETLAGHGSHLKEYTVAVQGLGRPATFDTTSDASVRVAARQLRFKLHEYYDQPGIYGDVEISLPKGAYIPAFTRRRIPELDSAAAQGKEQEQGHEVAVIEPSVSRPPSRLLTVVIGILSLGIVGLAAQRIWFARANDSAPAVIAVLPFENLTGNAADVILSDGLSDEITSALARDTTTRVIARTSAWAFRDRHVDIHEVGRQLGATHVVEGSVRRSGSRYRVSVQLVNASTRVRVWAEVYELDRSTAFGLFDLVSQNVHWAIVNRLKARAGTLPTRRAPNDSRVAEWLMEGRYFWNQRTDSGYHRAIDLFTRAAHADSSYAPAWADLASVYATMEVNHITPPGQSALRAYAGAERALAIDSTLGEAWTVIGMMRGFHDWHWDAADEAFQRAIALSPNYATAHSWYSNVLLARGNVDAAAAQLEIARKLDPLSLPVAYGVAQAYYYGRRWEAGLQAIDRALALNPDFSWSKLLKGKILKGAGRRSEARQIFESLKDSVELALLDESHRTRDIPRLLDKMTAEEKERAQFWIATNFAQIGWNDSAFVWLERAYKARQSDLSSILVDPMIDPVKSDKRYRDIVERMSLSESSGQSINR